MKLTWISGKRFSPAYGMMETGKEFNATAADGKSFIRQGLAVEGKLKPKTKNKKTKE